MPSQRILSSRWHDVFSARVKLFCPESVLKGCVLPPSNTVQTLRRLRPKTKRAMQGESLVRAQRVCEGI